MTDDEVLKKLKKIAPNVCFTIDRGIDLFFEWDGNGQDPKEYGYDPYTIVVFAMAIVNGEQLIGRDSLCGCYYKPEEPIGDIHGYLNQMLVDAAKELKMYITDDNIMQQLDNAIAMIKQEMHEQYQAQRVQCAQVDET